MLAEKGREERKSWWSARLKVVSEHLSAISRTVDGDAFTRWQEGDHKRSGGLADWTVLDQEEK